MWYSVPLLAILTAHEFGHYFACRYYNVDATLPYFIPAPLPLTGTLGAVIRIREAFPSKRALFDIGVAGPIAGFVVLVPLLIWGISMSTVGPVPDGAIYFGEPLLWKLLEWAFFGFIPAGSDVMLHPVGFAAWWGMLATALNLLPFGQLDGGHIMYARLGRYATRVSAARAGVAPAARAGIEQLDCPGRHAGGHGHALRLPASTGDRRARAARHRPPARGDHGRAHFRVVFYAGADRLRRPVTSNFWLLTSNFPQGVQFHRRPM